MALPGQSIQFNVLIPADAALPDNTAASDVTAKAGSETFTVDSITRPSSLRTVAVFDARSIPPRDVSCFHAQMKLAVRALLAEGVEFFYIGRDVDSPDHFDFGSSAYEIIGSPDPATACADSAPAAAQGIGFTIGDYSALGEILKALMPDKAPVQLIWVTSDFFSNGPGRPQSMGDTHAEPQLLQTPSGAGRPTVSAYWLNWITGLGLSIYPVNWHRQPGSQPIPKSDYSYIGGEGTNCELQLAPCMEAALHQAQQGWVTQLTGTPLQHGLLSTLTVSVRGEQAPVLQRYVANPKDTLHDNLTDPNLGIATVPLFGFWLEGRPGCANDAVALFVPPNVVDRSDPTLDLFVKPLQERIGLNVRDSIQLASDANGSGLWRACVALPPVEAAPATIGIILFNPRLYWAGIAKIRVH